MGWSSPATTSAGPKPPPVAASGVEATAASATAASCAVVAAASAACCSAGPGTAATTILPSISLITESSASRSSRNCDRSTLLSRKNALGSSSMRAGSRLVATRFTAGPPVATKPNHGVTTRRAAVIERSSANSAREGNAHLTSPGGRQKQRSGGEPRGE
eukprot:scaffold1393_cov48-Phaeocystis_antarctica.AAC.1